MLDEPTMSYSCAYFYQPNETLEDAQEHKLELICRKLHLQQDETLLDIGCGWGGLVIHAAKNYGVRAYGLTLSKNQFDLARQRVNDAGVADRVTIELRDYRDLTDQTYDKIASIGMYEHVGISQYPVYFNSLWRLLKTNGLCLNHGITAHKNATLTGEARFLFTYIFPNAELDSISHTQSVMEEVGFEILHVESMRAQYALTLREWWKRLTSHEEKALQLVPSHIYRAWKLYLAGSALGFEDGKISVYQTLAAKTERSPAHIPLTLRDVYQ